MFLPILLHSTSHPNPTQRLWTWLITSVVDHSLTGHTSPGSGSYIQTHTCPDQGCLENTAAWVMSPTGAGGRGAGVWVWIRGWWCVWRHRLAWPYILLWFTDRPLPPIPLVLFLLWFVNFTYDMTFLLTHQIMTALFLPVFLVYCHQSTTYSH